MDWIWDEDRDKSKLTPRLSGLSKRTDGQAGLTGEGQAGEKGPASPADRSAMPIECTSPTTGDNGYGLEQSERRHILDSPNLRPWEEQACGEWSAFMEPRESILGAWSGPRFTAEAGRKRVRRGLRGGYCLGDKCPRPRLHQRGQRPTTYYGLSPAQPLACGQLLLCQQPAEEGLRGAREGARAPSEGWFHHPRLGKEGRALSLTNQSTSQSFTGS